MAKLNSKVVGWVASMAASMVVKRDQLKAASKVVLMADSMDFVRVQHCYLD